MTPTTTNDAEKSILLAIREGQEVSAILPQDLNAHKVLAWLEASSDLISRGDRMIAKLLPIVGRLMRMASEDKKILTLAGFDKMLDLEEHLTKITGIAHTRLYNAKMIDEKVSGITLEQYGEIGVPRLLLVAQYSKAGSPGQAKLIEQASTMGTKEFKKFLVEKGHATEGELIGARLIINGNKDSIEEIGAFLSSPKVSAHVGSSQHADILLAMIGEVRGGGWPE